MSTTLYTVDPVTRFSAAGFDIVQAGTVVPDGVVWAIQSAAAGAGVTLNTSAGGAPQLVQVPSYYNGGTGAPVGDSLPVGAEVKDSTGAVFEKTPGGWVAAAGQAGAFERLRTFDVRAYGAQVDGTTDDTAAVQATLTAAAAAGGGTVYFPVGVCRINSQITLPNDGGTGSIQQRPFRLAGAIQRDANYANLGPTGGSVLDLRYSGANAKILSLGQGVLEITGLTLTDLGTSTTPFVLVTQSQPFFHHMSVIGNPSKSLLTCDQDAFVIGGTGLISGGPTNGVTSPFWGYGGTMDTIQFARIRRGFYLRNSVNSLVIRNCLWDLTCGTNLANGAALELDPGGTSGTDNACHGNLIDGNLIEVKGYYYGIKLSNLCQRNTFSNNSMWDPTASQTLNDYLFGTGASQNVVLGGGWTDPTKTRVVDTSGTNFLIGMNKNRPSLVGTGLTFSNNSSVLFESADGTVSYPVANVSASNSLTLGDINESTGNSVVVKSAAAQNLLIRRGTSNYVALVSSQVQILQPLYLGAQTTATSATAGAATALPATPLGYLQVSLAGTNVKIPYYSV